MSTMYISKVKLLRILALCFLFACRSSQAPSKGTSEPVQLYLTTDISMNSCMLLWERTQKQIHQKVVSGELDLYTDTAHNVKVPVEKRKDHLSFPIKDLHTNAVILLPTEELLFEGTPSGFRIYQIHPVTLQPLEFGFLRLNDCMAALDKEVADFIRLLRVYRSFPQPGGQLTESAVYTESLLLFDAMQKSLAGRVIDYVDLIPYDEEGKPMADSVLLERSRQLEDSMHADGSSSTHWIPVPEYDLWKGFMAYGELTGSSLTWNHFGLLYHPNTKYGGFNPGKITWFAISATELQEERELVHSYLQTLAKYALLYSADPEHYLSNYYRSNSIRIENKKY